MTTDPMTTPKLLPLAVRVTRYRCPACARSHATKQRCVEHIARCWYAPENRSCKTCTHFEIDDNDIDERGYVTYEGLGPVCNAVAEEFGEWKDLPVVGCSKWGAR